MSQSPQSPLIVGYGLSQSLPNIFPTPIVGKRAPTTADINKQLGQVWIYNSTAYILVNVAAGSATWQLIEASGGAGVFSALTVTPGPTSITGTTGINTAGAGVTTINTGGTGALNLGNATGNTAVTGSLTASTGLVATAGGIAATGTSTINTTGAATTSIATGGTGALNLGNATGNTTITGNVIASSYVSAATLYATGDTGGAALTVGFSDVSNLTANSTGAFTILSKTANNLNSTGFIKIYVGATAYWIPVFSTPAP